MDPIQQAAYIMAQAACAQVEAMGMMAENQNCLARGYPIAYDKEAFDNLILKYGIHHNHVISTFTGRS